MSHRTRTRRHRNTLDRARHAPRREDRRQSTTAATSRILIGYARCSTDRQDLTHSARRYTSSGLATIACTSIME